MLNTRVHIFISGKVQGVFFRQAMKVISIKNSVCGSVRNLNDGRVIPDFMRNAIEKSEILIHSDGSPTRSFCYVSDAIRAFFKLLFSIASF